MVDNHAARTSEQEPKIGGKHRWVSKIVIIAIFVGIIAALVLVA